MGNTSGKKYDLEAAARVLLSGGTGSDAARAAGYRSKNNKSLAVLASRMKKNPKLQAIMQQVGEDLRNEGLISAKDWLFKTSEVYNSTTNEHVKVRVLELLGKYHSLFEEKKNIELNIPSIEIRDPKGKKMFILGTKPKPE